MGEMSSDNVMDNGAQFDAMLLQEQLYNWEDPTDTDDDGPYGLWESCYAAIASANQALEGIEMLGNPANLNPQRGGSAGLQSLFSLLAEQYFLYALQSEYRRSTTGYSLYQRN